MENETLLRRRFSARLREAMDARGWNQSDLARRVGLSQSSLSDMLRNHAEPPALPNSQTLILMCRELRVSADWLLGLGKNPKGEIPSMGEAYQDGGVAAVMELRLLLEQVEGRWRGKPAQGQEVAVLATPAERDAAKELLDVAREMVKKPETRRRRRIGA